MGGGVVSALIQRGDGDRTGVHRPRSGLTVKDQRAQSGRPGVTPESGHVNFP